MLDTERKVSGGLAYGRVDEPQVTSVEEETDWDAHVSEKPLELGSRRITPWPTDRLGLVEVGGVPRLGQVPNQREPGLRVLELFDNRFGLRERRKRIIGREGTTPKREARSYLLSTLCRIE